MTSCLTFVSVHRMWSGCCSASIWVRIGKGHKEWEVVNFRLSTYNQNHYYQLINTYVKCKSIRLSCWKLTSASDERCWETLLSIWEIHVKPRPSFLSREVGTVRMEMGFSWGWVLFFLISLSSCEYSTTTSILWSWPKAQDSTVKTTVPLWRFRMATASSCVTPSRVSPLTAKIWSPRFNRPSSAAAPYK